MGERREGGDGFCCCSVFLRGKQGADIVEVLLFHDSHCAECSFVRPFVFDTRPSRSVCSSVGTVSVWVRLSTVIRSSVPVPSNTELGTRYSVFITNHYHRDYAVNAIRRKAIVFLFVTNYFYYQIGLFVDSFSL